jgi:hypothetical protein
VPKRLRRRATLFEALERRVLLTTYIWTGGAAGNWNDNNNWDDGSGTHPAVPNLATDDVIINQTADITVDISPTVRNLTAQGGSVVTFNFNNNQNITVNSAFNMQQVAGAHLGVVLNANAANSGKISAASFAVTGNATGSSHLFVNANTSVVLTGDFDAGHMQFDLTDHGTVSGANAYLLGKDLANGVGVLASALVDGAFTMSGVLRIGGNGLYKFEVNHGSSSVANFAVYNGSELDVHASAAGNLGHLYFTNDSLVGDPAAGAAFLPAAGLESQAGAIVHVYDHGVISGAVNPAATGGISISGGSGVAVTLDTSGTIISNGTLEIGAGGTVLGAGPKVTVGGSAAGAPVAILDVGTLDVVNTSGVDPEGETGTQLVSRLARL